MCEIDLSFLVTLSIEELVIDVAVVVVFVLMRDESCADDGIKACSLDIPEDVVISSLIEFVALFLVFFNCVNGHNHNKVERS